MGIGQLRSRDLTEVKEKLFAKPFVPDFSEYGGESSAEFERRVIDALQTSVLDRFEAGQRIALVIHGGPINVLLDRVEHGGFTGQYVRNIKTASITLLKHTREGLSIEYVSDTTHLDDVG